MGISVYDPTRRTSSSFRSPWDEEERGVARPAAPQMGGGSDPDVAALRARVAARRSQGSARPDSGDSGDKGLAESFFDTTIGGGIGKAINNPIVRGILQPLDILGVPQRAVASTINEAIDLAKDTGYNPANIPRELMSDGGRFSPQEMYNQTNPLYFLHGENAEDSIGMGDVLREQTGGTTPYLGNTVGRWVDAGLGFAGDVATDPLTYAFGLGVVDKGLDLARTGTRLGAAVAKSDDVGEAARLAQSPAWQAANQGRTGGSRASLAGNRARVERVRQAASLLERADDAALSRLYGYGDEGLKALALEEVQRRAGRGLGATDLPAGPVREVVETALNINPPAMRTRLPFTQSGPGDPLGGTQRAAQGLANFVGNRRIGRQARDSRLTGSLARALSPEDYEKSMEILRRGELADSDQFSKAISALGTAEGRRNPAGTALVLGQNTVNQQRKNILNEVKDLAGGDGSTYLGIAEKQGGTIFNQITDWVADTLAKDFGVTIPKLTGQNKYVPHQYSREFVELLSSDADFASTWLDRFGGGATQRDLLTESGRLQARQLLPGQKIDVTTADGRRLNFELKTGTIDEINQASMNQLGIKVLNDNPVEILDNYIQSVAEDIGTRTARAEQIARGESGIQYDPTMVGARGDEMLQEQAAAVRRLQARGEQGAQVNIPEPIDTLRDIPGIDTRSMDTLSTQLSEADNLTDAQIARVSRVIEQPDVVADFVDSELAKWANENSAQGILVDPEVQRLLENFNSEIRNTGALRSAYDYANRFFKTYAVLTPGFHVRNWLSALWMNAADGVPFRTSEFGMRRWKDFRDAARKTTDDTAFDIDAGRRWLREQDETTQQAFEAVFGSGAGGRFTESGVAEGSGASRFADWLLENRATRKSQKVGADVEGSIRLGMAYDTILNGGSVQDATQRITRIHFDYGQTSRVDDKAKQIAPFWSFFSRNIPMQIQQQWSRPGAYLRYEHLRDNFAQDDQFAEGEVPDYIASGKGIPLDMGPLGNWFEPDLPHTRVTEDVERLANITNDPLGMLSNVTPVISAPAEYAFGKNAFTGQTFDEMDVHRMDPWNPVDWAALLPAAITDNLELGASGMPVIGDRVTNAITSVDPNLSRIERLTGRGSSGTDRLLESWARLMGLPVRNITEQQIQNAGRSRSFDESDRAAFERLLAGM